MKSSLIALAGFISSALLPVAATAQTIDTIAAAPQPVESLTPVAGFRTYDSLVMRHDDLWMQFEHIDRQVVGQSIHGRDIVSYRFTRTGDSTPEGIPKSSALLNGTIHAREWQSPEVVTAIFEWLALEADGDPVATYLLENTVTVIHPICNPDGFLQTQRYYDQTVGGGSTGWTGWDGRMRRKNMRGVDEDLMTLPDHRLGTDLNRNFDVGFGGGSASPTAENYHGSAAGSEPETLALEAAAEYARIDGEDRLRFYTDYHSFGQLYYVIRNGSSDRDFVAERVYGVLRAASLAETGRNYGRICAGVPGGLPGCDPPIGATDEFFGGTVGCVSYTCEIRPANSELANGFILPDARIDEARSEILAATRAALYYMAGPPVLREIVLFDTADDSEPVYHERRIYNPESGAREIVVVVDGALEAGNVYTLVLNFDKPMRLLDADTGEPTILVGSVREEVELGSAAGTDPRWIFGDEPFQTYSRYPGDTLVVTLDLGSAGCSGAEVLSVEVADAASQSLDSDPLTVADWTPQGWIGYEGNAENRSGGTDAITSLAVSSGAAPDCNGNGFPDRCDIEAGRSLDANADGVPDDCSAQAPGDCNQDGMSDVSDAICLLGALFLGDPPRLPCAAGGFTEEANVLLLDWQPDGLVDVSDPVAALTFFFLGGPRHAMHGPEPCVLIEGCPQECASG